MRTSVAEPFTCRMPEERAVGPVEHQLADARVLEQHPLLAGAQVERHHVAERVVVGRCRRAVRVSGSQASEVTR